MARDKAVPKINRLILEEAASWFVEIEEKGVEQVDRAAFDRWLRASPEHVRAYLQISAFWEEADYLRHTRAESTPESLDRELAASNVLHLERAVPQAIEREPCAPLHAVPRRRSAHRTVIAASVATLCLGVTVAVVWLLAHGSTTYSTQIGEQRSITLDDGSRVELNAKSRLRVQFTQQARTVELLEGQALFQVAKSASRPFIVRSDDTSIRAVGTQFDVNRRRGRTVVTVLEGRVAVSNADDEAPVASAGPEQPKAERAHRAEESSGALLLTAGEQVTATSQQVTPPQPANVDMATAWTRKKLMFEAAPLGEVVEELNRHNRQQLIIDDAQLNELHVSGVLASTDSQRMIRFLQQRFGVIVDERGDEIHISRK